MSRPAALLSVAGLLSFLATGFAHPLNPSRLARGDITSTTATRDYSCFPALNFQAPPVDELPEDTAWWWCDPSTEYAFLGFSYEVTACQSRKKLKKEFLDIRNQFQSRYVRLYGACDREGFYDDIVEAAWEAGIGVHALIWFGFDGTDEWIGRRDTLFATLYSNPLAKYVTRAVQFGSEPLFDWVLSPDDLAAQVLAAKANLSSLGIPVTISELAYGYQEHDGAQQVLDAIDAIGAHMLPFFAQDASTGKYSNNSWHNVQNDLDWFVERSDAKKIYFTQNGWPSVTSEGVQNNSVNAVADVQNEHDYWVLLDNKCEYLKTVPGGGVGWFWHIYSDYMEPGYGLYSESGKLKFQFAPRTLC